MKKLRAIIYVVLIVVVASILKFSFWATYENALSAKKNEKFKKDFFQGNPYTAAINASLAGLSDIIQISDWRVRNSTREEWGLSCNLFVIKSIKAFPKCVSGETKFICMSEADRDAVEKYNRMIVSMPDYPFQPACRVDGRADAYIAEKKFLKDLAIDEKEYDKRRVAAQKTSIYAASAFGHIDGIVAHIEDINKCEAHYFPLGYAKKFNQEKAAEFLIKKGANPSREACERLK